MTNRKALATGTAVLWIAGALLLAGCQPPPPPPVPGQPLTWAQQHELDVAEAHEMHDRTRQERPCGPNDCKNH